MCADPLLSEGNIGRFKFRVAASLDKEGNAANPNDTVGSENPNDASYISPTGMSWFPGYAVNIETGERLNMMFGEDSWLAKDNGRDMLFNPTSTLYDLISGNARFGGKHYVYVMNHTDREYRDSVFHFPAYDAGRYIRNVYNHYAFPPGHEIFMDILLYSSTMYVGMPLAIDNMEWMSNDAKLRIRVAKPYQRYYSQLMDSTDIENSENRQFPYFKFTTENISTEYNNEEKAKSDLDEIAVVPNPYYAYAGGEGYERNALDNRVKITNLPEKCTITIYNVSGTLIRQFFKDSPQTFFDWDLTNFAAVPIAGGVYIIHVKTDSGEKVVKWFGGLRQPDLNVF